MVNIWDDIPLTACSQYATCTFLFTVSSYDASMNLYTFFLFWLKIQLE
jgi:hypothetical protein